MNSINLMVITPIFMLPFMGTTLVCAVLAAGSYFQWDQPGGTRVLERSSTWLAASGSR